mgnify:CR=1 FL=1
MNLDLPNTDFLMKVRSANCLTDSEFQTLSASVKELQVRRELDAVDSKWENDMRKYVSLSRSKGGKSGLVIVSRGEGFGGILIGLVIATYGGYMIWQILQESGKADASLSLYLSSFSPSFWRWEPGLSFEASDSFMSWLITSENAGNISPDENSLRLNCPKNHAFQRATVPTACPGTANFSARRHCDQSREPGVIFICTSLPSRWTLIVVSLPILRSPMT